MSAIGGWFKATRAEDFMASIPDSLVVLLHGVGGNGADLAPLAASLRANLPRTLFASPDAPNRFDQGAGRQWFSVVGVTEANRPLRIVAAREGFDRVVMAELEAAGLSGHWDRVALVGFSQGAIMALDAMATGRLPVRAVVAFSGRLATPGPLAPVTGARALLVHGEVDPVIPARESVEAAAALRAAGVAADCQIAPGLGHSISPQGVALAAAFLADALVS